MLACQLFGVNPWGHHLINVLLHAANTALVFLLFRRLTGATWRSLVVAALFGWHPLRVESVAWVTERKDVLSTFFGLLTLWCMRGMRKKVPTSAEASEGGVKSSRFLRLAWLFFALGLMSKAMLVTCAVCHAAAGLLALGVGSKSGSASVAIGERRNFRSLSSRRRRAS